MLCPSKVFATQPELLDKLLNQSGLIIKWQRRLKNKGNAVIAS
jgi:hypothetical protein